MMALNIFRIVTVKINQYETPLLFLTKKNEDTQFELIKRVLKWLDWYSFTKDFYSFDLMQINHFGWIILFVQNIHMKNLFLIVSFKFS